jgi:hypothetical protein
MMDRHDLCKRVLELDRLYLAWDKAINDWRAGRGSRQRVLRWRRRYDALVRQGVKGVTR